MAKPLDREGVSGEHWVMDRFLHFFLLMSLLGPSLSSFSQAVEVKPESGVSSALGNERALAVDSVEKDVSLEKGRKVGKVDKKTVLATSVSEGRLVNTPAQGSLKKDGPGCCSGDGSEKMGESGVGLEGVRGETPGPGANRSVEGFTQHMGNTLVDAFLERPVGFVGMVGGFSVFAVTLPASALGGNIRECWEKLVVRPARHTFGRPLGRFEEGSNW